MTHRQQHHPHPLPGDKPRYPRDRQFDVRHVKLDVAIDLEKKRLWGTCSTTLAPINDGLATVEFDCVELGVKGVSLKGQAVAHEASDGRLRIELDRPRAAGEELTVDVEYECVQPRRGLYFIAPDEAYPDKPLQAWTQGQDEDSRHWYPCYDYPNEQATSELLVTVPQGLTAIGNGALVATKADEKKRTLTYHFRQDQPHVAYLLSLTVGRFAKIEESWNGVPVEYYVPPGREDDARRAFGKTPKMLAFFSERLGIPYPYAKYAQVAVADFIFGGMENVSATTVTDRILHDERAHLDYSADSLVAHELAHQWFGDLFTCRDWSHAWLNEGFATYFDSLFKEHDLGVDEFRYDLFVNAEEYLQEDREHYRRPIVTKVYHEPIDVFDRHLYEKGSLVLHMLRFVLSDDGFWKTMRLYAGRHRGGNVVTPDLQRAVEDATGRNVDWFFDQWVYGPGHPELKAEYAWDADAKTARITVRQTQEGDDSLFRLPMDVAFVVDGETRTSRIEVREREQTFHFPLPAAPQMVRLDPGNPTLKTLDFPRPQALLLHQLQHDPDCMGRIEASRELAKTATKEAIVAVKRSVMEDPFWGVQGQSAKALGRIRSGAALGALVECLAVEHPKARRRVVEALGEFRDEAAADALLPVLASDASYYVQGAAAKSLGQTRSPKAFDALVKALDTSSHDDIVRVRAFEGFAELRDEQALPLCLEWSTYGRPTRAREAATNALGKLGEWLGAGEGRSKAFDRLVELLDDPWLRVRQEAVAGLERLGDTKAVPHLQRLIDRELDGRVVRRGREAVLKLKEGRARSDEVRSLREDIEKLQKDNRELRDRVDRLEAR